MYVYPKLGMNGWLGNQMFQYAALYTLSNYHQTAGFIPDADIDLYRAFPNLSLQKLDPQSITQLGCQYIYRPNESVDFVYDRNFVTVRDNTIVDGYFQSPLYFNNYKEQIKKEFSFSKEVDDYASEQLAKLLEENEYAPLCALHIRRTDYIAKKDFHHNLGWEEYYVPAIDEIKKVNSKAKFVIFSDDYEWCKENLDPSFLYHDFVDPYHDMCLMSKCDMHIIANSSFSWWGAYLADKSTVVAPVRWFGETGPKRWCTIWCEHWNIIGSWEDLSAQQRHTEMWAIDNSWNPQITEGSLLRLSQFPGENAGVKKK